MKTMVNTAISGICGAACLAFACSAYAQTVQPERVGLSSSRLERIDEFIDRYIEAGEISGAVTLVARNGRIAHLETQGVTDIASNEPMKTDTIFRIASMSKPVARVAIMQALIE